MASNTTHLDAEHSSGRSYIPATPRRWKHRNSAVAIARGRRGTHKKQYSGINSPVNFRHMKSHEVSARKLAAGLRQLRFVEFSGDAGADIGDGSFPSSKSKLANCEEKFKDTKDQPRRPVTILRSRNGLPCELESSMPCIKSSKEEATKWDTALNEVSKYSTMVYSKKLLEDTKIVGHDRDSVVTVLLEELLRAQNSINKLKIARKSSKKKVKQLLQNLEEEKVLWKSREHHKIEAMLDELKDKLERERRSRERMEVLNSKLVHELAVANESAKQFMTKYEEEKKERELTEEVCDELAKQIGEEKDKLEVLMRDSMKLCKEVEEEREMMQMTEQLREERVQMKLADAKDLLEDKYNQMVKLIDYLLMFLKSKGAEVDTTEIEDTQLIKQAVESVNIQRIVELSYDFSNSDDVFPIYEEHGIDNEGERMIRIDSHRNLTGPLSTIHIESVEEEEEEEGLNKNSMSQQSSPSSDCNGWYKQKEVSWGLSTNNMNPHITRGMKGCIEWPRGIPKTNSKVIPLEERVKSQKSQLQHILKPKVY